MDKNGIIRAEAGAVATTPEGFDILLQRFAAYIDARPQSVATYTKGLKHFFGYLASEGIREPRREDVQRYRDRLIATTAPTTARLYLVAVRLFFRWTDAEKLYPDIADRIKGPKMDRGHRKGYLTASQMKDISGGIDQTTANGKRDYAILLLMATAGLRCIEVVRANFEDLATVGGNTVLYVQGKGHDERTEWVIVAPQTEKAIRAYLATRKGVQGKQPLFASVSHHSAADGRLTTRSVSRICKGRFCAAGYDDHRLTAHSLRHTAATLAILGGASLLEVQEHLRHARPETTMVYINETRRNANTAAQRIASAIF